MWFPQQLAAQLASKLPEILMLNYNKQPAAEILSRGRRNIDKMQQNTTSDVTRMVFVLVDLGKRIEMSMQSTK